MTAEMTSDRGTRHESNARNVHSTAGTASHLVVDATSRVIDEAPLSDILS